MKKRIGLAFGIGVVIAIASIIIQWSVYYSLLSATAFVFESAALSFGCGIFCVALASIPNMASKQPSATRQTDERNSDG